MWYYENVVVVGVVIAALFVDAVLWHREDINKMEIIGVAWLDILL